MEKQIVVITGASRGLGREVALGLAQLGYRVALVARNRSDLESLEREIVARGGTAVAVVADVTDISQVQQMQAHIERHLGIPSILVNAAGIFGPLVLVSKSDPHYWIQTLQTNAIAPYLTCRTFVGGMLENGWGRIINFSSAASLAVPGPLNSAYVVSKTALNQLTRQLAVELDGSEVTANVIHPGEVKTAMWSELREAAAQIPTAHGFREWARWVETTGGDPPQKTLDLILKLLARDNRTNGQFLWIEDGLQHPLPSW